VRANLDASLKLVDRANPLRSELLASSLRPHGAGPSKRPIFQGSNDRAYQILATWVNKLQATSVAESVVPAKSHPVAPGAELGESFASQRGQIADEPEQLGPATRPFVTGPVTHKVLPPLRVVPGKGVIPDTGVDPDEFPLPFAVSGAKPNVGPKRPVTQAPATKVLKPDGSGETDPAGGGRAATAVSAPARKKAELSQPTETKAAADPASSPGDGDDPADTDAVKKKPRKPPKLDPDLLQRTLQLRNQGR